MKQLAFATAAEQEHALDTAVAHLRGRGLLAYPTETVYGLGCTLDALPLRALAALKGDRTQKPFLLLIDDPAHVHGLHWNRAAQQLAQAFWPGPLTLALGLEPGHVYPPDVLGPGHTVAVRRTAHSGLQALLQRLAAPITSTSANPPGQAPALSGADVVRWLTPLDVSARFLVLDGGTLKPSPPSTVVDCSQATPRLVRSGAIPLDVLARCVHDLRT